MSRYFLFVKLLVVVLLFVFIERIASVVGFVTGVGIGTHCVGVVDVALYVQRYLL